MHDILIACWNDVFGAEQQLKFYDTASKPKIPSVSLEIITNCKFDMYLR